MAFTIGFDATSAAMQSAGIGRYTRDLLAALARQPQPYRYRVFYASRGQRKGSLPPLNARFRVRGLPVSDRFLNLVWHRGRIGLPVQLFTGPFDVFHSPDFTLPPTMGKPSVLTIHDLAFLTVAECAYPTLRAYLERAVSHSARRADHIIAVSESTRRDIHRLLDVAPEKITTILEGVSGDFHRLDPDDAWTRVKALGIEEFYILSVGTLEPRKNYERLFQAYALLRERGIRQQLVIAGTRGWMYEPIFRRLRELKLEEHVRFVRPSDAQLVALYSAADVFVYPSLYEGFGIPPLEALACGTAVTCSSTSSLPEVVGDAALTFDPWDVEQIADCIARILFDDSLRTVLQAAGPPRAALFNWDRTAAATVQLYEKLGAHA